MGNGTSNDIHFYEYDDYDVDPFQNAFYRLIQVDYDGNSKSFEVVKAEALELQRHSYKILRSNTLIEIVFIDDHNESTEIVLMNSEGAILKNEKFDRINKNQTLEFDLQGYPTGWYVIGISRADNFHFDKMIHVN